MSLGNFCIADPYNNEHINLFKKYEQVNKIENTFTATLDKIRNSYTKERYISEEKQSNNINQLLFIESNDEIKTCCYLKAEKDVRLCEICFPNFNGAQRKREILLYSMQYAFDVLGMENVVVSVENNDKILKRDLELCGFENLNEVNGKTMYLKEKEIVNNMGCRFI